MELGIFAKTFTRSSLAATLDAVTACGLSHIQFNMSCAGLESMPLEADYATASLIKEEVDKRGIMISAVSGTFNMAHPDQRVRLNGLSRLHNLAAMCEDMGTNIITLCTGTRNRDNMWVAHKDNESEEAWTDLIETMEKALKIAEAYSLTLAIEPEAANIINNAEKAKQLINLMQSNRLMVVLDAANLISRDQIGSSQVIMAEAFELLGEYIVLAHAKDISSISANWFVAAGKGELDYNYYLKLLKDAAYKGPLILHGLQEHEVGACIAFLKNKLIQ